ncbi:HAD hydrolase-like protein [candidate division KSB1 bacterium]|nr:HAD hydrolase-like protein [candidate division KSB1 bacterium]
MSRALIFDIGGVLSFDVWESTLLDRELGLAYQYNLDPDHVFHAGLESWQKVAYTSIHKACTWQEMEIDYWQRLSHRLGLNLSTRELIDASLLFIKPFPGMKELLLKLKSLDYPMIFCSNNSEFWYHRQCEHLDLEQLIPASHHVLSSRVGQSKSDSGQLMFKRCIEILDMPAHQCVFIDDRQCNIDAALAFGFTPIFHPSHSTRGADYLHRIFTQMGIL